jgi:sulfate adenylyltransferase
MYAKARRGEIKDFTEIDDPYEPPAQPEATLDNVTHTPEENAHLIMFYLYQHDFVRMPTGMLQNGMKVQGQRA